MSNVNVNVITDAVREAAQPLAGVSVDYDPLINLIGDARFCLLGEAPAFSPRRGGSVLMKFLKRAKTTRDMLMPDELWETRRI